MGLSPTAILHLVWWTATAHLQLPPPAMPTHPLVNRMGSIRVLLLLLQQLAIWAITIRLLLQVEHNFCWWEVHELVSLFQETCYSHYLLCYLFSVFGYGIPSNFLYTFQPLLQLHLSSVGLLCSRNVPPWFWLHGATSSISRATSKLDRSAPELDSNSTTRRFVPPPPTLHMLLSVFLSSCLCHCTRQMWSVSFSLILNHIESCLPPKKRLRCRCLIRFTSKLKKPKVSPLRLHPLLTPCRLECKQSQCGSSLLRCHFGVSLF